MCCIPTCLDSSNYLKRIRRLEEWLNILLNARINEALGGIRIKGAYIVFAIKEVGLDAIGSVYACVRAIS